MPFETWLLRYPVVRQQQLRVAYEKVTRIGLDKSHAKVSCFIKNEASVKATDPRNISPRQDEFLVTLGPFISAIEEAAHKCPYLVKGLNLKDRDAAMSGLLSFPIIMETDYSRYDATISPIIMSEVEMTIFESCFPSSSFPEFHFALKCCMSTVGSTPFGWSYTATGRCSGDAHTSIGNGLINRFNTWVAFRELPSNSWLSFHEGDDGIVGLAADVAHQAILNVCLFGCLGFNIKVLVHPILELSGFCGRILYGPDVLHSMCQVRRTLSKFHVTCSQLSGRRAVLAKALSYWSTDQNTPIVGMFCYVIITLLKPDFRDRRSFSRTNAFSNHVKSKILDSYDHLSLVQPVVLSEARTALELSENIPIVLQLSIESSISTWLSLNHIPNFGPMIHDVIPHVDDDRVTYFGHSYPSFMGI
jgi:hypothetical protein